MEKLEIAGRLVGPGEPPYVVAEIGSNHNGDMEIARRLVDAAVASGVDAVKFQSWSKESLISRDEYLRNTTYSDPHRHFGSLEEMVDRYQLTPNQHSEMATYCAEQKITFLSSPFSAPEVDLLESLGVPAFKIASMDINNLKLLKHVGALGKPVILSTGMSGIGEIERALMALRDAGSGPICLLHCVSIYPPKFSELNLRNIKMLRRVFDVPVGFSDHTTGVEVPVAAVAVGACLIEKHFTLDHDMPGWDHQISADPLEMQALTSGVKRIFSAMGSEARVVGTDEEAKKLVFRRSIVLKHKLDAGHILQVDDLDYKRPGTGIPPDEVDFIVGRTLKRGLGEDEMLSWEDIS